MTLTINIKYQYEFYNKDNVLHLYINELNETWKMIILTTTTTILIIIIIIIIITIIIIIIVIILTVVLYV